MSDDLIKRSDAIKALRKLGHEVVVVDKVCSLGVAGEFIDAIRAIPSADRPQGYWTKTDVATYRCSECGKIQIADDDNELNYCCCCGSHNKMRRLKGADDE